jgi:hypothetical protein
VCRGSAGSARWGFGVVGLVHGRAAEAVEGARDRWHRCWGVVGIDAAHDESAFDLRDDRHQALVYSAFVAEESNRAVEVDVNLIVVFKVQVSAGTCLIINRTFMRI